MLSLSPSRSSLVAHCQRSTQAIRAWLTWSDNRSLAWRLLALAGCWLLFWSLDWMALRNGLAQALHFLLPIWGHWSTVHVVDGQVLLVVDGIRFWISARCTYVDLVLCISPFLWRPALPIAVNFANLLLAFVAVQGINFARLLGTHLAVARGTHWTLAHDVPDLTLWSLALAVAVLCALQTDQRDSLRETLRYSASLAGRDAR